MCTPTWKVSVSEEILGYFVGIASHPRYIVMQTRKNNREKSYLWYSSWPPIMYGQFPITIIIFFFGIDVNNVNLIVFVVIWGFSGCLVCFFFTLLFYFIFIIYYYHGRLSLCTLLLYSYKYWLNRQQFQCIVP